MQKSEIYRLAILKPVCQEATYQTCKNWSKGQSEKINCQFLSTLLASFELRKQGDWIEADWTIEAAKKNTGYQTCWAYPRLFLSEQTEKKI